MSWQFPVAARQWFYLPLLLVVLSLSGSAWAETPGFSLANGNVRAGSELLFLDARFDVELGNDARDALENGVPLTMELQVRVLRPRRWWWDAQLAEFSQRQELRYHALSRRYVIHNRTTGDRRTFFRRDVALAAWTTLDTVPLVRRSQLEPGQSYTVEARVRLDLDALPHPLRTVAYVNPNWRIVSEWYKWPLEG